MHNGIEAIVNSATKLNINYSIEQAVDEDKAEEIYLYVKEDAESDSIEEALEELGHDFTEEEIRLVRIKFICEQGNRRFRSITVKGHFRRGVPFFCGGGWNDTTY